MDIVEELRASATRANLVGIAATGRIENKAADEIERLRDEVLELTGDCRDAVALMLAAEERRDWWKTKFDKEYKHSTDLGNIADRLRGEKGRLVSYLKNELCHDLAKINRNTNALLSEVTRWGHEDVTKEDDNG